MVATGLSLSLIARGLPAWWTRGCWALPSGSLHGWCWNVRDLKEPQGCGTCPAGHVTALERIRVRSGNKAHV